jgi:diguanylate cyclase
MDRVVDEARDGVPGALIYIDLDHFKSVNDSLGHEAGDGVLTTVASVLTRTVRSGDILFRLGGDEFCILLQAIPLSEVKLIADRIRINIAIALRSSNGNHCAVAASMGIATIDGKLTKDRVMRLADAAVYRAKAAGGDRIQC